MVEGAAERVGDLDAVRRFLDAFNAKYSTDYGPDCFDPAVNATFRVRPVGAIGLIEDDSGGSPTKWTFRGWSEGEAVADPGSHHAGAP